MRVLVFGSAGQMGSVVCNAVAADPQLQLAVALDPANASNSPANTANPNPAAADQPLTVTALSQVDPAQVDVAVDFTVAQAALPNALWCAQNGIHAVIGTTGLAEADMAQLQTAFSPANSSNPASPAANLANSNPANCLVAPNFAIGAVLLMRFAETAAKFFNSAEVIEQHHDAKIDAPSGTALQILQRMANASSQWNADPTQHQSVPGARGGLGPGDIPVHSVRLRGLVAHHEVLLGTDGEVLTLRHDSLNRTSFMSGVLHACKVIANHPGLTVGLDAYLDL